MARNAWPTRATGSMPPTSRSVKGHPHTHLSKSSVTKREVLTPQNPQMLESGYEIYMVTDAPSGTSKNAHDHSTRAEERNSMASDVDQSDAPASAADQRASESYRRRAADCRERAVLAHDVARRLNYLQLAEYWNDMARDAETVDRIRWRPHGALG
jgi:hypothetical protein